MSFFPPAPRIRASDADRERTVDVLRREAGTGRLSAEELSARLDKAFRAGTLGELQTLIADLPEGNINPLDTLIGGVVRTSVQAVRWGLWFTAAMIALGIFVPMIAGLATHGHGIAALVALGILVLVFVVAARHVRGRSRRATE